MSNGLIPISRNDAGVSQCRLPMRMGMADSVQHARRKAACVAIHYLAKLEYTAMWRTSATGKVYPFVNRKRLYQSLTLKNPKIPLLRSYCQGGVPRMPSRYHI